MWRRIRWILWGAAVCMLVLPLTLAMLSPLQAGREFTYVTGALAGVLALSLLFVQPMLAAGFLPGLGTSRARRWHRRLGLVLLAAVALHILGLYLASPDDMRDALLLVAPTPFSLYGVVALVAVALTGLSAALRSRFRSRIHHWNRIHSALTVVVVTATLVHAWMIDGTMNGLSKMIACAVIAVATIAALVYRQWVRPTSRGN
ncbi:ferric reductase-like transmembrane domain-containing protein [Granulosicoccus sp. 3-233]|uniref:ferric reductase-like transmembrane domain-containing protein n=1 Tax=Granulosicoccus sp. 3-233 TaxID=3417969 RepID=UPI003D340D57